LTVREAKVVLLATHEYLDHGCLIGEVIPSTSGDAEDDA
jgi:hypothetical protein